MTSDMSSSVSVAVTCIILCSWHKRVELGTQHNTTTVHIQPFHWRCFLGLLINRDNKEKVVCVRLFQIPHFLSLTYKFEPFQILCVCFPGAVVPVRCWLVVWDHGGSVYTCADRDTTWDHGPWCHQCSTDTRHDHISHHTASEREVSRVITVISWWHRDK